LILTLGQKCHSDNVITQGDEKKVPTTET
jgi:hypothetical protein